MSVKMRNVLILIGALLLLGFFCNIGSLPEEEIGQVPSGTPISTPTVIEREEQWVEIARLTGTGSKKSAPFKITAKVAKVTWTMNTSEYSALNIFLYRPGESMWLDMPATMINEKSGESMIYETGEMYLDVSAANTKYTVIVYELR